MKNIFKKSLLVFLIAVICLGSFGCSCNENKGDENNDGGATYSKVDYTTGIDYTGTSFNLVENNTSTYSIVVPKTATTVVSSVAKELNEYVVAVSKASLTVVNDEQSVSGNFISLGNTKQFQAAGYDISAVKDDGFIIKTKDNNVYIASNVDAGVMFGVYSFLERFLGIRWLTESATHIPESDNIAVYPCDILEEPTFARRVWYDAGSGFASFYNHRRYYEDLDGWYYPGWETPHNTTDYNNPDKHSIGYCNKYDVVNKDTGEFIRKFTATVNRESEMYLYELHPEWFTDMEGTDFEGNPKPAKMASGDYDICFTSGIADDGTLRKEQEQSVLRYIISKVKNALAEDANSKKLKYFQIAQLDNGGALCQCNKCIERRTAYKQGGIVTMFINCIEHEVNTWLQAEQGRTVIFSTFAYHTSVNPPVVKNGDKYEPISPLCVANDNVQIRLAPIGADYTYGFGDENQIETYEEIFEGWTVCSKSIRIWDYVIDFYASTWWYPNLHYMKDNFIYYKEHGVVEVFNECAKGSNSGFWTNSLKSYVVSKLYWNLGWNVEDLVKEYVELYYGPAAQHFTAYLNLLDGHYAELRATIGSLDMKVVTPKCDFYNANKYPLNLLERLLSIAENAIIEINESETLSDGEKELYVSRLEVLKITPMAMIFKNYDVYYNARTINDFAKEFFDLCDKCGVKSLGTGQAVNDLKITYGLA